MHASAAAGRRLRSMTGAKHQPGRVRQIVAALALLALVLTALAPGEAVQATTQAPETASLRGVASQVGQLAPEFTVTTLDGLSLTSADLLAQEKPFILYFFATW